MKLHFDSKQEFQLEAVKAITDIFEGQPLSDGNQLKTNAVLQMRDAEIDLKMTHFIGLVNKQIETMSHRDKIFIETINVRKSESRRDDIFEII